LSNSVSPSSVLDRVLVLEMVRVTEAAAIAASYLIGRGDEKAADAAAVEAMRAALNELPMDGTGFADNLVGLDRSPTENIRALAAAKGCEPNEIMACVLDRPRHAAIIAELRALGCGIMLIPDGDVAGIIATTDPDTGIDIYMGQGGAPEGVLAAAALRCVGGQMQGRLFFRNDDERGRARRWGIENLDRIYRLEEMASGDCIFAATGVTDGSLLKGVKRRGGKLLTTESIVMRASSGTVRRVTGEHYKGVA